MLASLALFAPPFAAPQIVLASGSRRALALAITLTPLLSVALGALLQTADLRVVFSYERWIGHSFRLEGATGNAAVFGMLAFAGFAIALHEWTRPNRPYAASLAVANLILVILSGTRMAIFASFVFLGSYAWLSPVLRQRLRQERLKAAAGAAVVALTLLAYGPTLLERMFADDGETLSLSGRGELWAFYWQEFLLSPVFGRGLGAGFVAAADWLPSHLPLPHNEYLHLLVVGGVVGFGLLCGAIGLWYRQLLRVASLNDRGFLFALIPALAAYAVTDNILIYSSALALYAYLGVMLTLPSAFAPAAPGVTSSRAEAFDVRPSLAGTLAGPVKCGMKSTAVSLTAVITLVALFEGTAAAAAKAFPTAEGFGASALGGRGGVVYHVTTLDDSGAGSLRACVEASGSRTCVFRVGGTITAHDKLRIANPQITIAGQTAPGGGILIRNAPSNRAATLEVATSDVVIRHLRIRSGPSTDPTCCLDAVHVAGGAKDVILDHVSASWSVDGVLDISGGDDIRVQWSFITEPLRHSVHEKGAHAFTLLFGSRTGNISFHHNLIGYGVERNPKFGGTKSLSDLVNSVVYNPKGLAMHTTDCCNDQRSNLVGNYLRPGPDSPNAKHLIAIRGPREGYTYAIYVKGNYSPFHRTCDSQPEDRVVRSGDRKYVVTTRHPAPFIATTSASEAFEDVLTKAGATLPRRDAVDERIVTEVRTRTGRIIDHPDEVGGWPTIASGTPYPDADADGMSDLWEQTHGLDPSDASDRNGDGYTNIEEFLNQLAGDQAEGSRP